MDTKQKAFLNQNDRIECNGVEFTSGDIVDVFIDGVWQTTRIEFDQTYYSIDGFKLLGNPVKPTI